MPPSGNGDLGSDVISLTERLQRFWEVNPVPPPTGLQADKAFFDALSDETPTSTQSE
jgi:antitoxin VapB